MRVSGVFSLAGAIIVGLIIADLLAHGGTTNNLINTSLSESRLIAGK
jgi:hypothetical protein